ncbi:hypothetical protein H257_17659 [Aphanomyces astaci]|uniref:Uncharacterized protein n=1 Tax=Aphanomyces astaci TaxID=112090 RepID=W4FFM2_APHAT|nr:hypothetical protein H257_17659 [Aphanomyces astaci]ETV65664.1 hypothetical protein H257_17659 [Aphanomyces astaci]|eukprot:XP_009844828.1 hypothetical protein H257_17659 [Aphanomyces astaci]
MDAKDVADTKDSVRPSTLATDNPMSPTSTPPIVDTTSDQDEASSQQDTSPTALTRTYSIPAPHLAPNSPTAINDVGAPFSRTVSVPASVPQEGHPPHFPPRHVSSLPPQ